MWVGDSSLCVCTKLGGEWVWFSGYDSKSISPYFKPVFIQQEWAFAHKIWCAWAEVPSAP